MTHNNVLENILGGNVHLLPDQPINGTLFLHQQHTLVPRWRRVARAFQNMNKDLKRLKYAPDRYDAHYVPDPRYESGKQSWETSKEIAMAGAVLTLGEDELYRQYMPMPALAVLIPHFRYLPNEILIL